jgi:hypothetical protein
MFLERGFAFLYGIAIYLLNDINLCTSESLDCDIYIRLLHQTDYLFLLTLYYA